MKINLDSQMMGIGKFPLHTLIPLAVQHGYGAIQFPLWEITSKDEAVKASRELADNGLQWGLMPMDIDMLRENLPAVFEEELDQVKRQMDLAQAAGVHLYYNHVWPGSNVRSYEENFDWCARRISKIHAAARDHGIRYGLEFLGPKPLQDSFRYPFIRKLRDGLPLADSVSKEIGVVVDTFHWYTSESSLDDLKLIGSADRILNLHVNDGWKGRLPDQQQDLERELPLATGVIDSPSVIRTLDELGYQGIVSVEPFEPASTRLREMPLTVALREVAESVRKVFSCAGID